MTELEKACKRHGIYLECEKGNKSVPWDRQDPPQHWVCSVIREKYYLSNPHKTSAEITVDFWMGSAHKGNEPTVGDVLSSLLMDYASVRDAASFEDWASDLGYTDFEDYPKARETWEKIEARAPKIEALLGAELDYFLELEH